MCSDTAEWKVKMMQKIIEKNGVELEPDVYNDMEVIMNEMMDAVRKEHLEHSLWHIFGTNSSKLCK